ncbi:MAG: ribbon-helix-helix domain-containing protein [Propionibacteriaceae bacterium]|nr:ribbon-helix-helix domain-containing protein [Propionibacteriaceae bacterium]
MRTTVRLDPDIKAEVERLQQAHHISLSDAINSLARNGLERRPDPPATFVQRTVDLGLRVDVSNVAEALDLLDGVDHT